MKKAVTLVIVLSIGLGLIFWLYSSHMLDNLFGSAGTTNKEIDLVYWGLDQDESVIRPILENYHLLHPNVRITYTKQSALNYQSRLQTQINAGQGPDIFTIHNTWLPVFAGLLSAAPPEVFNITDYSQTFYPVAKDTLTSENQIYAVPSSIDGLGLYCNLDILKAAGVNFPGSWQDFVDDAKKMTVKDTSGQIQTAGAALGSTSNVDYWPQILGLLFYQQPQGDLTHPNNQDGVEVLQFYTNFITDPRNKVWDSTLPSSTQMFANGKLAFYFAPLSVADDIKKANPALNFQIIPVPQLPGKTVGWAGFWAEAVSAKSPNQAEAWKFLEYLSSAQSLETLNQQRLAAHLTGIASPRQDMRSSLLDDPLIGAFVDLGPFDKSWYLNPEPSGSGINEDMTASFKQAVDTTLAGGDPGQALNDTANQVQQILAKYNQ